MKKQDVEASVTDGRTDTKCMRGDSKEFLAAALQDVKTVLRDQDALREDNNALMLVISRMQRDLADAEREIERVTASRDVLRTTLFRYLEELLETKKPDYMRWLYAAIGSLIGGFITSIICLVILIA